MVFEDGTPGRNRTCALLHRRRLLDPPSYRAWTCLTGTIEWHFAPKHGSWLNMAVIEPSTLSRQCLHRRIPDTEMQEIEAAAWVELREDSRPRSTGASPTTTPASH